MVRPPKLMIGASASSGNRLPITGQLPFLMLIASRTGQTSPDLSSSGTISSATNGKPAWTSPASSELLPAPLSPLSSRQPAGVATAPACSRASQERRVPARRAAAPWPSARPAPYPGGRPPGRRGSARKSRQRGTTPAGSAARRRRAQARAQPAVRTRRRCRRDSRSPGPRSRRAGTQHPMRVAAAAGAARRRCSLTSSGSSSPALRTA